MPSRPPALEALAFALALASLTPASASAEPFSSLAREAHEVSQDIGELASPLLASCDALVGRSRELCETNVGRAREMVEGRTLLVSMPITGFVEIGPYEPRAGGFRIRLPGFQVIRPQGVVSTRPRRAGIMPEQMLAEAFVRVAAADAPTFAARNDPERLRLRLIFRFGRLWQDPRAERAEERRGVLVEMRAAQVYNASSGEVLLDSTDRASVPSPPPVLDARRVLFGRGQAHEVLWRTPDDDLVLFHVRAEVGDHPESLEPIVLCTRRAETRELVRFDALEPEAAVDVIPHGRTGLLLIITEERSRRGHVGRGQVLLLQWNAAEARAFVRARWRGANDETPPAWVRDPNAELPDALPAPAEAPPDEPSEAPAGAPAAEAT
jgi:hypothetical protein